MGKTSRLTAEDADKIMRMVIETRSTAVAHARAFSDRDVSKWQTARDADDAAFVAISKFVRGLGR